MAGPIQTLLQMKESTNSPRMAQPQPQNKFGPTQSQPASWSVVGFWYRCPTTILDCFSGRLRLNGKRYTAKSFEGEDTCLSRKVPIWHSRNCSQQVAAKVKNKASPRSFLKSPLRVAQTCLELMSFCLASQLLPEVGTALVLVVFPRSRSRSGSGLGTGEAEAYESKNPVKPGHLPP